MCHLCMERKKKKKSDPWLCECMIPRKWHPPAVMVAYRLRFYFDKLEMAGTSANLVWPLVGATTRGDQWEVGWCWGSEVGRRGVESDGKVQTPSTGLRHPYSRGGRCRKAMLGVYRKCYAGYVCVNRKRIKWEHLARHFKKWIFCILSVPEITVSCPKAKRHDLF